MALKAAEDLSQLSLATADNLAAVYKRAKFNQDALLLNEQATLESVMELASNHPALKEQIATLQGLLKEKGLSNQKEIDAAMKAQAALLGVAPVKRIELPAEEKAAAKMFPRTTAKVKQTGYGVLQTVTKELLEKHQLIENGRSVMAHAGDIAKLTCTGKNSVLDIKKMQDAQFPDADSLTNIIRYMDVLKEAGLVE